MRRRVVAGAGASVAALFAWGAPASAHGIASRSDLPLPLWQFLYAAGAALVISFLALRILWPSPRLASNGDGVALPRSADVSTFALSLVLRVAGVVLFVVTLAAAWFGTTNSRDNLAPVMVYVVLWVGMQGVSAVFGDVWRALSPFDTIAALAQWVRGRRPPGGAHELDDDGSLVTSHWPAALGVLGFVWLELCYHSPDHPRVLAIVITGYSVVMFTGAARFGRDWLRNGDAFAVLFSLLAMLSPFFRDGAGRLRVRWPLAGLATMQPRRGTIALITILLGSTGFDGLQRSRWWQNVLGTSEGWGRTTYNTFGLLWIIGIVAAAYVAASMGAALIAGTNRDDAPRRFVTSLVPIALAYAVAHYFSLFVFEGQSAITLISDPFGKDWNLFGTAANVIDLRLVSPHTIAWVQVGAIVIGHVAGVLVAHDVAVQQAPARIAVRSQYPMLAVMIGFTVGGLALLLGA